MEAIEAELEAELAAIGNVSASYEAADLDGDRLSSDDYSQDQDANPLSDLDGFGEFALCVRQADEVKDRAAVAVAKSEAILGDVRYETNDTDRINDKAAGIRGKDEGAGWSNDDEREGA